MLESHYSKFAGLFGKVAADFTDIVILWGRGCVREQIDVGGAKTF